MLIVPDIYANAGGVTVSYFEWLKNLSHVRIGRMGKRYEESQERRMLHAIEVMTGKKFSEEQLARVAKGPDELDFVRPGWKKTMVVAYQEILQTRRSVPNIRDLRTAAFFNALEKIARDYLELGIFPLIHSHVETQSEKREMGRPSLAYAFRASFSCANKACLRASPNGNHPARRFAG